MAACSIIALVIFICNIFVPLVSTQDDVPYEVLNRFVNPPPGVPGSPNLTGNPEWTQGTSQNVTWETTSKIYTISLFQEPSTGNAKTGPTIFTHDCYVNGPNISHNCLNVTQTEWMVNPEPLSLLDGNVFYLFLEPEDSDNPISCHFFNIFPPYTTSTSSTVTSSVSPTFTSMLTSLHTIVVSETTISSSIITARVSSPTSSPGATNTPQVRSSRAKEIGAGIGGGVGGALILALVALGFVVYSRRNRNKAVGVSDFRDSPGPRSTHEVDGNNRWSELPSIRDPSELPFNPRWSELTGHQEHSGLRESTVPLQPSLPAELPGSQPKYD